MVLSYQISKKLSAPQVRGFADWLGHIEYRNYGCNFTYTSKCYEDINQIFLALQQLELTSGKTTWELWLCAERGTIQDYAKSYGSYEENLEDGIVENYEEYKALWMNEYPDPLEWFNFVAVGDPTTEYRAIFLRHRQILEVDEEKKNSNENTYPEDISEFTCWLLDSVNLTILAIKEGLYNKSVEKLLPYKHRVGTIKRSALWDIYPEDKKEYYKNLSEDEIKEFLLSATDDPNTLTALLTEITANDFYRFCSLGYQAIQYDIEGLSPKEQYYRFADGRDEGLKNIDPDSPADFDDWYRNRPQGGHPWEVCRGGNSTHISLYIRDTKDYEYYLIVGGPSLWRSAEAIKFYLALHHAQLPVLFNKASLIKDRLRGEEKVGIVPEGVFPRYCSTWFPNENIISFMNLSADHATEEIEHAEWYPLKKAKLLTQ